MLASTNASTAEAMFLVGAILAVVAGVIALMERAVWAAILSGAVLFIGLGLYFS